jgi:hypothetical protein
MDISFFSVHIRFWGWLTICIIWNLVYSGPLKRRYKIYPILFWVSQKIQIIVCIVRLVFRVYLRKSFNVMKIGFRRFNNWLYYNLVITVLSHAWLVFLLICAYVCFLCDLICFYVFLFAFYVFLFAFYVFLLAFYVFLLAFYVFLLAFYVFLFAFYVFLFSFYVFLLAFYVLLLAFYVLLLAFYVFLFAFYVFLLAFYVFLFAFYVLLLAFYVLILDLSVLACFHKFYVRLYICYSRFKEHSCSSCYFLIYVSTLNKIYFTLSRI